MKHFIILIIVIFLCNSCSNFTNEKGEKRKAADLKYKKQEEFAENKNYQYVSQLVSYKNNISKDTVDIVLKEYYKAYKGFIFNNETGKLEETEVSLDDEINKLDFIKNVIQRYDMNEKLAFIILGEIDSLFSMEGLKDDIGTLEYNIDDLESGLSKDN